MFKIGNRVKVMSDYSSGRCLKDYVGTVVYTDGISVCVEFDEHIDGHDGGIISDLGKKGHCWWVGSKDLVIISPKLKIPNGNFIVKSNNPQYSKMFIKQAHIHHDLCWSGGYNEELTYHEYVGDGTIYYIVGNGIITFEEDEEFVDLDYPLYNIEELFRSDFKPQYKFNTSDDVDRVLVNEPAVIVFTKDGYKGVAVCDNKDKFNHKIGYEIAYAKIERARATKKLKEVDKLLKSYL